MIGKFGIAASFGIFFLYASELLPTVVRSQAMAIASFVAGIGLFAFPYIVYLVFFHVYIFEMDYSKKCYVIIRRLYIHAFFQCS